MKRLFQSVSLLLVALWLPATLHCDLEAAEVWLDHGEHADAVCCAPNMGCKHDGCETLEGSALKPTGALARVPLPAQLVCSSLICMPPPPVAVFDAPLSAQVWGELAMAWVPKRHFARRAAPKSRAPSLLAG